MLVPETTGCCQGCEVLARAIVALGIRHEKLTTRQITVIGKLQYVVQLILALDREEEKYGVTLDFQRSAQALFDIANSVGLSEIGSSSDSWRWVDEMVDFIEIERHLMRGVSVPNAHEWYFKKSCDVRFASHQLMHSWSGSALYTAERLDRARSEFIALEVFDDILDMENVELWAPLPLRTPLRLGQRAQGVGRQICLGLRSSNSHCDWTSFSKVAMECAKKQWSAEGVLNTI